MTSTEPTEQPSTVVPPSVLERKRWERAVSRLARSTIAGSGLPPEPPVCKACGRLLNARPA
jgi:hypothetical protein